jgi:purine-nucleoside phosphorylase
MSEQRNAVDAALAAIREHTDFVPDVAIILGTGLGGLATEIDIAVEIPYAEIPGYPEPTVVSHTGRLLFGTLAGRPVVAMDGRFHLYEGFTAGQIALPVRVLKALGAHTLLVSNACGGLNHQFGGGDVMVMTDHINLLGANPIVGPNDESIGPRFPDMGEPYDRSLIDLARKVAIDGHIPVQFGVYVAVLGPNLETPAEYRFLRAIGADVVGMSTIPETIAAIHCGLRVAGFSVVTDMCLPDALEPVDVERILAVAARAEPRLTALLRGVVERLDEAPLKKPS